MSHAKGIAVTKFDSQLDRLRQLKDEGDWDGYGTPAPNETALACASSVVTAMLERGLTPAKLIPSGVGGVAIYFQNGVNFADFRCLNDGTMQGIISTDADFELFDVTADSVYTAIDRIQNFIGGRQR